jgi:hypothetical protein
MGVGPYPVPVGIEEERGVPRNPFAWLVLFTPPSSTWLAGRSRPILTLWSAGDVWKPSHPERGMKM